MSGCGIVTYALSEDAAKAVNELKKAKFMGLRSLKIHFAKRKLDVDNASVIEKEDAKVQLVEGKDGKAHLVEVNEAPEVEAPAVREFSKPSSKKSISKLLITQLPCGLTKKQLYKKLRKYGEPTIDFPFNDESSNLK
jgi:nucleolar protein 4